MLLQFLEMFHLYYLLGIFLILALMIAVILAAQRMERFGKEASTGFLADWWRWINRPPQGLETLLPKHAINKNVQSWLCPICGSKITKHDVEKLEYGYNVECKYCGATISSSQMRS